MVHAWAKDITPLPQQSLVPGGVALVRIEAPAGDAPRVALDGAPVMVLREDDHWLAVLGVPLDTRPGKLKVAIERRDARPANVELAIKPKQYVVQRLRVVPGMVDSGTSRVLHAPTLGWRNVDLRGRLAGERSRRGHPRPGPAGPDLINLSRPHTASHGLTRPQPAEAGRSQPQPAEGHHRGGRPGRDQATRPGCPGGAAPGYASRRWNRIQPAIIAAAA